MGERTNYQTHTLTRVELLSALYLYLNAVRGIEINPSEGQLSQKPFPSDEFLLETWDAPDTDTGGRDG